ncbi:hypothetical protein Patl1_32563 [Pistacia atlantica]|uniref:Uncharacterized protein n=1 Tax=Pistacia atlantica TaxID=434234 RepID=A0ACC1ARS7_9ROSI|nr:hypothetical protein Patl1_32563 [Pistacia atlantica]
MEKSKNPEAPKRGKTLKTLKKLRKLQKCQKPTRVQVIPGTSRCNLRVVLSRLIEKKLLTPGAFVCYSGNLGEGWITSTGIKCKCCNKAFTISDFEAHVGSKKRRPAANIFLEDGRSLLDCQKEFLCNNKSKNGEEKFCDQMENKHEDVSYDMCCVCHNGGELIICRSCRSTYHKSCLGLKDVPTGDWFCTSCRCVICGVAKFEKTKKNSLDDEILHTCDQCEHKFHMGCLRRRGEVKVKNFADDKWFCNDRCEHTFTCLHKLSRMPISLGVDNLTWRLLKYNKGLEENQRMLNDAIDVMHESFEQAVDPLTGKDLAEDVILNSKSEMKHKNFKGFYTAVVGKKGEIGSAATVRVFDEVAEIPLVATRFKYRGQGMCRRLMGELERQLVEIGVVKLILPSAPSVMTECDRLEYSDYTFLDFQDTIMCQKMLMKKPSANLCQSGATLVQPHLCIVRWKLRTRVVN